MKPYSFSALLSRMKYITRLGLMRSTRAETLAEHSAETAQLAHLLALLANGQFGADVRPDAVTVAALYHDAAEILTGDLPTPVKYSGEALKNAYKALEQQASARICANTQVAECRGGTHIFSRVSSSSVRSACLLL